MTTGYEGLLSSTAVSVKKAQFKMEDRIFSGSSVSGECQLVNVQLFDICSIHPELAVLDVDPVHNCCMQGTYTYSRRS
jgi:hypothetical protein